MQLSATLRTFPLGKTAFALMSNANIYGVEKIVLTVYAVMLRHECYCVCLCVQSLGGKFVCIDPDCCPGFAHPALPRENHKRLETEGLNHMERKRISFS